MIDTHMKFIHQLAYVDSLRSKQHFIVKIDFQLKCYVFSTKYYHINISSQIEMSMSFATMCQGVDSMLLIFWYVIAQNILQLKT